MIAPMMMALAGAMVLALAMALALALVVALEMAMAMVMVMSETIEQICVQARDMLLPLWRKYKVTPPKVQIYYDVLNKAHICQFTFENKGNIKMEININNGIDIQIPPDFEGQLKAILNNKLEHKKPFVSYGSINQHQGYPKKQEDK